jgi:hypothetical protein
MLLGRHFQGGGQRELLALLLKSNSLPCFPHHAGHPPSFNSCPPPRSKSQAQGEIQLSNKVARFELRLCKKAGRGGLGEGLGFHPTQAGASY